MADDIPDSYATPEIYADLPLEPERNEAAFFRFKEYSTTFARMIAAKRTRTPLVLGINGKWGSGKTTLLRLIKHKLDSSQHLGKNLSKVEFVGKAEEEKNVLENFRRCRTVWFNAWKYADEDSLLAALIRAILEEMSRGDLKDKLKRLMAEKDQERYDVIAAFLGAFSLKFGAADFGIDLNKYKTDAPFKAHTAFFDHFNAAFEQLLAVWVHDTLDARRIDPDKGVLAVFIDDLDRCLPAKTVQVLEAVKLFLDKHGVAFVIGADEDVIRRAVEAHYQNEKITGVEAGDYLDKIFQIRFPLPPLRSVQVGDYMRAGLSLPPDLQNSIDLILAGTETNPRRIKTTLNYLQVNWALLKNSGQASDDLQADFLRWLLIELASAEADKPELSFANRARGIEDLELRFKFIADALNWARNIDSTEFAEKNAALIGTFRDYERFPRLRRVLRQGGFSDKVTANVLDRFVYWSALAPEAPVSESVAGLVLGEVSEPKVEVEDMGFVAGPVRGEVIGGIEFAEIPAGKFLMGSTADNPNAGDDEKPQHTVDIPYAYRIGRYLVTNAQYRAFAEATKTGWKTEAPDDHPAVQVNWNDAVAFCAWLTDELRQSGELSQSDVIRLPTEAEWEKAARGEFGNEYPWGNEWDASKCNTYEGGKGGTTPVGAYSPAGDSPYGAADMAGNVWEWCSSLLKPYPYKLEDGREDLKAGGNRVLRGGAWYDRRQYARVALRNWHNPHFRLGGYGFRVGVSAPVS